MDTAYVDAGGVAKLTAANAYADIGGSAIRNDMAAGDASTLASANALADGGDAPPTLKEWKAYADRRAASTLQSANARTDQNFTVWNDAFDQFQQLTDRGSFVLGASFASGESPAGAGFGFEL